MKTLALWTPRLRTIFFMVNILILLLPLSGIVLLRLYESVLIRRTESELIVQGAHVSANYLSTIRERLRAEGRSIESIGVSLEGPLENADEQLHPIEPKLDLAADPIHPPPEPARPASTPVDPVAREAGQRITEAMRLAQKITLAGIRVVDQNGVVVATTRTELGKSLIHREEVRRALEGHNVSLMRQRISDEPPPPFDSISRGTQLRVFVAMPVVAEGRVLGAVVLSRTPQAVSQSLWVLRWHILVGALGLLAMVAFVSLVTSRTITRPMEELIRQSELAASGERFVATPRMQTGTLEVRRVAQSIARMAQALEERADYIDTFARGVSHEFKTPLASMRGAVELLRDHIAEMTPEERDRFLENLESDIERLTRLVSRLTALARADVIKPAHETTDAVMVVEQVAARFREDGLVVETAHARDVAPVRMAREALESVMANLLDNARQHGGPGVTVKVETRSVEAEEPQVVIAVSDDGPGISKANLDRVFDQFFTTARNRGGSGLGLNIVKKLVEVHGGTIRVTSEPGATTFELTLPAA